ncbi:MAG: TetR/AcrR family transcriptional regulator [Hyphomicrobiaceae bacterium]|nr:TetR/AcrR family transcriptional regulator [Hyphomicrobiaceae bacterium]
MEESDYTRLARSLDQFLGIADLPEAKRLKQQRIVEAATKLFLRHGYRKTSVEKIAQRAGMAKGTVYLYFKTKADLLIHAICAERRNHVEQFAPLLSNDMAPRERFRQWLLLELMSSAAMPLMSRLISGDQEIRQVIDEMSPQLWEQTQQARLGFAQQMLDQAATPHYWTPRELTDRAATLIGVLHASLMADERMRIGLSRARFGEILADLIVNGVCHDRPPPAGTRTEKGTSS